MRREGVGETAAGKEGDLLWKKKGKTFFGEKKKKIKPLAKGGNSKSNATLSVKRARSTRIEGNQQQGGTCFSCRRGN